MNRIDRLFGITTMLQSRKYVPAEQLAAQFGISVRTVYRDVKALIEQGIPVSLEQHKGYFLVQGYFLPPVAFTKEEANALLLMEKMIFGFADRSIYAHYTTALNKVKAVMRGKEKDRFEQLNSQIRTHVPQPVSRDVDYLATLQSAISDQHIIEVEYRNNDGITTNRHLEPIGLVFYSAAWHIIAWCHLRNEYRDFKVVHMLRLKCTGSPFRIGSHISLNDYIARRVISVNPGAVS